MVCVPGSAAGIAGSLEGPGRVLDQRVVAIKRCVCECVGYIELGKSSRD